MERLGSKLGRSPLQCMTGSSLPAFRLSASIGHLKAATSLIPVNTGRINARKVVRAFRNPGIY